MLEIDSVTRRFGDLTALDNVSFSVPEGAFTGFVGGNGAGKTTTMRIVMGVLAPTSGEVRWNGSPITRADRAEFGYMLLDGENTLSGLGSPVQVAERYGKAMGLPDGVADGKYLFEKAEEGESAAVEYVDGMIDALARGIYNLSVSFNPDRVIIGGGISVREDLIARIRERTAYHLNAHGAEGIERLAADRVAAGQHHAQGQHQP